MIEHFHDLGFLKDPKYYLHPLLELIEAYMLPLEEQGVLWGYDLRYMLTGLIDRHPREPIDFTNKRRGNCTEFCKSMLKNI